MKRPKWVQQWVNRWRRLFPNDKVECSFWPQRLSWAVTIYRTYDNGEWYQCGILLSDEDKSWQNEKWFKKRGDRNIREALETQGRGYEQITTILS